LTHDRCARHRRLTASGKYSPPTMPTASDWTDATEISVDLDEPNPFATHLNQMVNESAEQIALETSQEVEAEAEVVAQEAALVLPEGWER
jgi:hypothetical protein